MDNPSKKKTHKQDFVYAGKTQTEILFEEPSNNNPYISQKNYIHGYDVVELVEKKRFVDTLLLLFTGELPSDMHASLLERLMVALINLGPRHPAVKASMVAGVSKTSPEHLLPIGLSVLGGKDNGAQEVEQAVKFLLKNISLPAEDIALQLIKNSKIMQNEGEVHISPGFGNYYGSVDSFTKNIANSVLSPFEAGNGEVDYISWGTTFAKHLNNHNMGILKTGLAAMVFCQLGIAARESIGLYQLICAPGIFAHGAEQTHKPITAMPMLSDEQHVYTFEPPIRDNS